jgi:hypothetical protein
MRRRKLVRRVGRYDIDLFSSVLVIIFKKKFSINE